MTVSLDSRSVIVAKNTTGNKRPGLAPPVSSLLDIMGQAHTHPVYRMKPS
jgi:hypothetical protein